MVYVTLPTLLRCGEGVIELDLEEGFEEELGLSAVCAKEWERELLKEALRECDTD